MKNYDAKQAFPMCCVGFRDMISLYLTGIKTKMSAQLFYSACLSGKVSLKDIGVDTKGKSADIPVDLYNENVKTLMQPTCFFVRQKLMEIGYTEFCTFEKMKPIFHPIN